MKQEERRGISKLICNIFIISENIRTLIEKEIYDKITAGLILGGLLFTIFFASLKILPMMYFGMVAVSIGECLFLLTIVKTTSLRSFFYFLVGGLFSLSLFIFMLLGGIGWFLNHFIGINVSIYLIFVLYFLVHMCLWIFVSLMAEKTISKLANTLFATLLGVFTAILNIVLIALPDTLFDGQLDLSPIHLWINLFLLPFVFISILSLPMIELKEYWMIKYELSPKQ